MHTVILRELDRPAILYIINTFTSRFTKWYGARCNPRQGRPEKARNARFTLHFIAETIRLGSKNIAVQYCFSNMPTNKVLFFIFLFICINKK